MTRVILVSSGKGGSGKTTLTSNLAASLAVLGKDVIAIDANLTTPNLGMHVGMHMAPKTLHHVLRGEARVREATYPHPLGFKVMPGSMNVDELKNVDVSRLSEVTVNLIGKTDFVLLDCAAGLGREAVSAIDASDEMLVVTNPEMPSVVDALKAVDLAKRKDKKILGVVVNRKKNRWYELPNHKIEDLIGAPVVAEIPEDVEVQQSIYMKKPLVSMNPDSPAAVEVRRLAHWLIDKPFIYEKPEEEHLTLIHRLASWLSG
jgi:septum site-determining protein MinD